MNYNYQAEKDSLMIFGLGLLALLVGFGMGVGSHSLTGNLFTDTWRIVEAEALVQPNDYQITLASLQALGDFHAALGVAEPIDTPQDSLFIRQIGDVGVITINTFVPGTAAAFDTAMAAMPDVKRLVIDVRENRGGVIDEAVRIADRFIDFGILAIEQHKSEEIIHRAEKGALDLPVIVLVNHDTYSAAEVLALALRHYGHIVVGQPTYGKASLQRTFAVADDYALQLTTGYWYGPRGETVAGQGVIPNVVTAPGDELQKALELLEGN